MNPFNVMKTRQPEPLGPTAYRWFKLEVTDVVNNAPNNYWTQSEIALALTRNGAKIAGLTYSAGTTGFGLGASNANDNDRSTTYHSDTLANAGGVKHTFTIDCTTAMAVGELRMVPRAAQVTTAAKTFKLFGSNTTSTTGYVELLSVANYVDWIDGMATAWQLPGCLPGTAGAMFWKVDMTPYSGNGLALNEMEARLSAGGADVLSSTTDYWAAESTYGGYPVTNLTDNSASTLWSTNNGGAVTWVVGELSQKRDFVEWAIQARADNGAQAAERLTISYSYDRQNWTAWGKASGLPAWLNGEWRTFGADYNSSGQVGTMNVAGATYGEVANELSLIPIITPSAADSICSSLDIEFGSSVTNGTKLKPVIYSDSGGEPTALLLTGAEVTLVTADASTRKTCFFGSSITLTKGTKYWVGWLADNSFTVKSHSGQTKYKASQTYASGPPSSPTGFSSQSNSPTLRLNVRMSAIVYGYWDAFGTTQFALGAGYVDLIKITVGPAGVTATDMYLRLNDSVANGDKVKPVIYSNASGDPSALVATGTELTLSTVTAIASSGRPTEVAMVFPTPPSLSANTDYWVGVHSNTAGNANAKSGTTKWKAAAYGSGPPSSISSPSSSGATAAIALKCAA